MKKKIVLIKLCILTILGKHKLKSDVIKHAKIFKSYGVQPSLLVAYYA